MVFSQSRASCSVKNSLPFSSAGRSMGVPVALFQMPCRSGWPSGVRGGVQAFFARKGAGLVAVCANTAPRVASSEIKNLNLIALLRRPLFRLYGRLAILAVQKFFH